MLQKTQYTIVLTLMYMLGIFSYFKECEILASIITIFVTIYLLFKKRINSLAAISMTTVFIFGFLYTDIKMHKTDDLRIFSPTMGIITGEVASIPTSSHLDKTKFFVNVDSIKIKNDEAIQIKAKTYVTINDEKTNYSKIKVGDKIKLKAIIRTPQTNTNPSQFSYRNYLKTFNTFTTAYVTKYGWEIIGQPDNIKSKFIQNLNILRQKIIEKHKLTIKTPNLEILGGIVFGDDAISAPEDIKNSFINSGLMHILAASGLNVALIFGIWFFIFSKLKIHYKTGITTGILLILIYTLMTGLGPPVIRAALMIIFALIGKLIDRDADNIALLLFVASIILTYNPAYLLDIGFQLSFIVTLGLLMFCPIAAEKTKNCPQIIAGAIYVPFIAQIVIAPIQIYYFNTFALYSLVANIISLPFISIISFLGFISSILAMIPKLPITIIIFFDKITDPILTTLINISNFFANLKYSLITVPQCSIIQIVLYYALLIILFIGLKNSFTKKLIISFLITLSILLTTNIPTKNNNLEAIFFNVGNADAILVKTPDNKYSIIDTAHQPYQGGFSQAKAIIYEYLKDEGIKEIEYLIITHYDDDHAGGAESLMNLIKIKNLVTNPNYNNHPLAKKILKKAQDKQINIIHPKNEESFLYKEGKIQFFRQKHKSDNNSSIITIFSKKDYNMLFAGDAEIKIIEKYNLPNKIDILKVAHHGAKNTTNQKFLQEKKVKIAILSTGPNKYFHPDFETLYNLQTSNIKALRTDVHNAIKVTITNKDIYWQFFNEKNKKWSSPKKRI